jgi:hypothetical protein
LSVAPVDGLVVSTCLFDPVVLSSVVTNSKKAFARWDAFSTSQTVRGVAASGKQHACGVVDVMLYVMYSLGRSSSVLGEGGVGVSQNSGGCRK